MKALRNFWALPAFLRLSLAFSVQDDLLAFPQYEVRFLDSYVPESYASSRLALAASHSTASSSPGTVPDSKETQELSKARGRGSAEDDADDLDPDAPATYEAMLLAGERYLCRIPVIDKAAHSNGTAGAGGAANSADDEERELARVTDRGWELLQGMKGNCIYYLSGWWSYSFCYNKEVKQFHQLPPGRGVPAYPPVEDTQVHSYVLGRFPKKDGTPKDGRGAHEGKDDVVDDDVDDSVSKGTMELAKLQTKGETRYMVQKLGGGTTCDLTGKERKIEVQFHCNPSSGDRIGMIKEVATCSYLMVIYTPRLCNDVAFMPVQKEAPNTITCRAIYPDNADFSKLSQQQPLARSEEAPEADVAAEEEDSLTARTAPSAPLHTVGGIVVGARINVGGPGKVIEKSVVVGGGKETLLGTVADSEGMQMSDSEMRKLSIRNPSDVEKLKKELIEAARGKGWRLDLVETPRGREYRGIIDGDEEEEPPVDKKAASKDGTDKGRAAAEDAEGTEEVYQEEL